MEPPVGCAVMVPAPAMELTTAAPALTLIVAPAWSVTGTFTAPARPRTPEATFIVPAPETVELISSPGWPGRLAKAPAVPLEVPPEMMALPGIAGPPVALRLTLTPLIQVVPV